MQYDLKEEIKINDELVSYDLLQNPDYSRLAGFQDALNEGQCDEC